MSNACSFGLHMKRFFNHQFQVSSEICKTRDYVPACEMTNKQIQIFLYFIHSKWGTIYYLNFQEMVNHV